MCSQYKGAVGCYQSVSVTLKLAEMQTAKSKQVIHSGITAERSLFNSLFNICLSFHERISKTSTETHCSAGSCIKRQRIEVTASQSNIITAILVEACSAWGAEMTTAETPSYLEKEIIQKGES